MNILYQGGSGELTEKKSRFIAELIPVTTEEEALSFIAAKKKEYWDARHNCSAYIIGDGNPLMRCSDDGEPAQTAGRPMLDVLAAKDLTNVCAVVTRYFGGVLLGTGGLVRAYQGAVSEALKNCVIAEKLHGRELTIDCDYNSHGKIDYILREMGLASQAEFAAGVILHLLVPEEGQQTLEKKITDATGGKAVLTWNEECDFIQVDGGFVRL